MIPDPSHISNYSIKQAFWGRFYGGLLTVFFSGFFRRFRRLTRRNSSELDEDSS